MSSTDENLDDCVEEDDFEIIAEGLASSVSKTWASVDNGEPQLLAIKTSTTIKKWAKEPHDIIKECRLLRDLSHPNIIQVFDFLMDGSQSTMNIWMPYIPYSLPDLLDSEAFTPKIPYLSTFLIITRSLMTQILDALVYLHAHQIAHRDLKPANVLLTPTGRVVIIDFGIAWDGSEDQSTKNGDLWPEDKDKMYFEVSTGPYRSPELLFGTRSYNAYAIDLWSLGALFAEFFTVLAPSDLEYAPSGKTRYLRTSLFDASRGEIGLAWSIFRILGTPREPKNETEDKKSWAWPGFKDLPDARKVEFTQVEGVGLDERIFPNLPKGEGTSSVYVSPDSISEDSSSDKSCHLTNDSAASTSTTADADAAVDLIRSLLRYLPARRIEAKKALEHPFLSPGGLFGEVLMPHDMYLDSKATGKVMNVELNGARRTLGELLLGML